MREISAGFGRFFKMRLHFEKASIDERYVQRMVYGGKKDSGR
jgi:hypothetical protein